MFTSIGPSGTVKLAKKESAPKAVAEKEKKPVAPKVRSIPSVSWFVADYLLVERCCN